MDVLLLVVDSLRAQPFADGRVGHTPFLDALSGRALAFDRAYASECWTLPSHLSLFTGLMPSEHGAHFQSMAYRRRAPTLAEVLAERGYATECLTRNSVLDGSIEGVVRGFERRTEVVRQPHGVDVTALFLALAKPRFRRHLRHTGFFHRGQRDSAEFARRFARALQPADDPLLERLLARMSSLRRQNRRFFAFANLYDVHAPYPPRPDSLLLPWRSAGGAWENLLAPYALSRLGQHRYLKRGFRVAAGVRRMLEKRYRRAVALMDQRLSSFFAALETAGLRDDLLVALTSDHGEGFGEHGLFLHDASLYETHVRVPLWLMTPWGERGTVDGVVSTRHLFGLIERVTRGGRVASPPPATLLDPDFRAANGVAVAQHFHYPHLRDAMPVYRSNQFAAVDARHKLLMRGGQVLLFDLVTDPQEIRPRRVDWRTGAEVVSGGVEAARRSAAIEMMRSFAAVAA